MGFESEIDEKYDDLEKACEEEIDELWKLGELSEWNSRPRILQQVNQFEERIIAINLGRVLAHSGFEGGLPFEIVSFLDMKERRETEEKEKKKPEEIVRKKH